MAMPRARILEAFEERTLVDTVERPIVGWSGVFGGLVIGAAVVLLLTIFGIAIGVTALPTLTAASGEGAVRLGLGVGIWIALSLLVGFFVAGLVSTRATNHPNRAGATIQGTLVWALGVVLVVALLMGGIGGDVTDVFRGLGLLGRGAVVSTLAGATGVSTDEASRALTDLRERLAPLRDDPLRVAAEVRAFLERYPERTRPQPAEAAEAAHRSARIGSWAVLSALLVTLLVAIGGASLGAPSPGRFRE